MIGAGIYTTSGYTLASLGSPWRVIAAWAVGGVIAICGAISYGALATRFTESGGEYLFLARALHPVAGMMAGWVSLLAGFTGAMAFAATALESYLLPLIALPPEAVPGGAVAVGVIVLVAVLHTTGLRPAAHVQDVVVFLKFALIGGLVIMALVSLRGGWPGWQAAGDPPPFVAIDFATALVWISLSYSGFNAAVYIADEVKDARRNVPRALVAGTVLVTILYVAVNAIFVLAPAPAVIAGKEDVATLAAGAIGGPGFVLFVRGVIVVSLFTSVSALVMTGPRVYAKMAEDGFLPRWFRFEGNVPGLAIWFQAVLAIVAVGFTELRDLLSYLGFTLSVSAALTVSLLFLLHLRGQKVRVPLYPLPPLVFVLGTLVIAILSAIEQPREAIAAAVTILFGMLLYPWFSKRVAHHGSEATDET